MEPVIYMNNAATSWPKPKCVAAAVGQALRQRPGSANRGGIDDFNVFQEVRKALATLMGITQPEQLALGANSTWGLNLAIQGFSLAPGSVVVTSTAEHNSVLRPLYKLYEAGRIQIVFVAADSYGRIDPLAWQNTCQAYKPALCVFTHASNVTGAVNDAARLTAIAKDCGAVVLLDASQSLGVIPVRAEEWGIDMVAFTGHKYLLGPQGTGGLYVRPELLIEPLLWGGTGIRSDMETMPLEMPIHLEAGTGNEPSYHGLLAALEWAEEHPLNGPKLDMRMEILKHGLADAGADVISPPGPCTPVVSFNIEGKGADEVGYILGESFDIICRSGLHCAPKLFANLGCPATVRLSLSRFTTEEEIDEVINAVKEITR